MVKLRECALFMAVSLIWPLALHDADAQTVHRGTDVGGLQPLRGYFSPHDWEHFDTKTGNLVITQVDLALPGNHGFDLVVQRTYNNDTISTPHGPQQSWRWSVGLAGLVMRIGEKTWPTNQAISSLLAEINNTPYFVMGDGSIKRTRYFYQYIAGKNATATNSQRWVIAAGFLKYNRTERKLWMPDGRTCLYDTQGRLTSCTDAYGNGVSLSYTSTHMYVTQHLGTSQQRQLTFELNGNGEIVALVYLGRRWDYPRTGHDITKVTSPVGLEWQFGYSQGKLASVTLPGGGTVTYGYVNQEYDFGTPEEPWLVTIRVLASRTTNGVNGGTWTFSLTPGYNWAERLTPTTEIVTPSNTTLRWVNFTGSAGTIVMGGGTGFLTHTVLDASEEWWNHEQRQYTSGLRMVSHAFDGPAQITGQTVWERDPATPSRCCARRSIWWAADSTRS